MTATLLMRAISLLAALTLFLTALSPLRAHVRISTKVTWDREIAPIVQARCVSCHREGGRAPMSLASYEDARPWAKAIKEEVLARRMPKWHVVRGYGDFSNDPSLSAFEIALIASWADGGAPKSLPVASGFSRKDAAGGRALPPVSIRTVSVPCTARTLPAGRLVGLRPMPPKGSDFRIDVAQQPLLWLKDFDPAFAETYWLRNPLRAARATSVRILPTSAPCSLELLYAR